MKKQYFLILTFIFIGHLMSAQIVNIPDANFKNALLNDNVVDTNANGHPDADADTNNDGEIQVTEAEAIIGLYVSSKNISSLVGIEAFINLEKLAVGFNSLNSLDLSSNTVLEVLSCNYNQLTSLNISSLVNLRSLVCGNNQLTSLDVTSLVNLETLRCGNNQLSSIDVSTNVNLKYFGCSDNQLTSLDVSANNLLFNLHCGANNLTELEVVNKPHLQGFGCHDNQMLHTLTLENNPNLLIMDCFNTNVTSLDFTTTPRISSVNIMDNSQLESIFMKNGENFYLVDPYGYLVLANLPNLSFICVDDEDEKSGIITSLGYYGVVDGVEINTYCSFSPGGTYYTVSGETKFDSDSNGCDINDEIYPNMSFSITNGTETGIFTANTSGNYAIPLQEGIHTITPQIENPSYFSVSPTSITVDFPTDTSPNIQDFCITSNGNFNDLEVTIVPLEEARPGFDTDYKIIYRNKGTTTLSGAVSLNFEDDYMNVISTNPMAVAQNTGNLSWNYTNLAPLESRSILYTMNLNTPTDANYPLNGGDHLDFTANITPTTSDETPTDNTLNFVQTVVNSFDPNDKTCLEGNTITEDKVGEYVHYLIRFENTGTASAINVVVTDDIDAASYDVNTLSVIDGSHEFITRVDGQKVEFIFENIDLPFDDATNDGYVLFKIKTKTTLALNDTFMNKAEIFFDYNAPIITNDETTMIVEPLSVGEVSLDTSIEAFPKPTSDMLFITGENAIKTIDVFDLQGKLILSKKLIGNQIDTNISVKTLSKGLYILKVTSDKGVFTDKIIKQ
ncbi:DUF7619 domain-containing protein [Kordia sp.]|uniref:T9SS type A sorting domain-containing protein n=1 Tax=Kordia sp. TaxID=1965332 RepID=UPI003B5C0321